VTSFQIRSEHGRGCFSGFDISFVMPGLLGPGSLIGPPIHFTQVRIRNPFGFVLNAGNKTALLHRKDRSNKGKGLTI
jgi:hypothetical protein